MWDASLDALQIVNGLTPVFPTTVNTYYVFEKPVTFHAEASLAIARAIIDKAKAVLDKDNSKSTDISEATAVSANATGSFSSAGVRKFVDSCFTDPSKEKIAIATKLALDALDAYDKWNNVTRVYTVKVEVAIKGSKTIVTESVYNGTISIFENSNTFDQDMKPYLKKLMDMLDTYKKTK